MEQTKLAARCIDALKGLRHCLRVVKNLGIRNHLLNRPGYRRLSTTQRGLRPVTLHAKYSLCPLLCRPNTSDADVFNQIFVEREYSCLDDLRAVDFVVDCGANVGYSTAYFLTRFAEATAVAVEPDPSNFEILRENLAPFGNRATLVQGGVWSRSCDLVLSGERYGDGREWSRQVRECRAGETPQVRGVDIGSLLGAAGKKSISLLKIDIERAEATVFSSNYAHWIGHVDTIVIELHDQGCEDIFFRAIQGLPFSISRCGELTVCKRRARKR
jgi:FkbM family methyltransferase